MPRAPSASLPAAIDAQVAAVGDALIVEERVVGGDDDFGMPVAVDVSHDGILNARSRAHPFAV